MIFSEHLPIFLLRVRDENILGGRQLTTESGLSTVAFSSDNGSRYLAIKEKEV